MSWNTFSERTFHYNHFHLLTAAHDGLSVEEIEPELLGDLNPTPNVLPMRRAFLGVKANALTLGVREYRQDTFVDASGEAANYHIYAQPCSLVSVHFDGDTGMNSFTRVETLLNDPSLLTERALGCLAYIRAAQDEIRSINVPSLVTLLERTAS